MNEDKLDQCSITTLVKVYAIAEIHLTAPYRNKIARAIARRLIQYKDWEEDYREEM